MCGTFFAKSTRLLHVSVETWPCGRCCTMTQHTGASIKYAATSIWLLPGAIDKRQTARFLSQNVQ